MRIPNGMTEAQVIRIIESVSSRFGRFKFGIYDADDIRQEAVILCIDGLERYKEGRPLENFLAVHVRNRLLTLMRDQGNNKSAKFLLNYPVSLDNIDEEFENSMKYEDNTLESIIGDEMMEEINTRVPIDRRLDLIKMLNGAKVSKNRRRAIIELVGDLFEL